MEHSKLIHISLEKSESGAALILVLMLVVLTTIMILAFFISIQTETKSVRSAVSAQGSKQLADIAVQSVISQIQQATTQGVTVAWVSQPGLIRCYDNTGTAVGWYKLYSSPYPVLPATDSSGNSIPITESLSGVQTDLPTAGWATPGSANYGVYTDINSPVYASDGSTLEYPIVNPSSATSIATANGTSPVLGFDIANTSELTPWYTGTAGSNASPTNNPAAMPVLWIYILKNGAQVPAAASGTAGVVTVAGASSANPIVGRVAYWTDDDTCKLNINTAGNGTYFDSPRFSGAPGETNTTLMTYSGATRDALRLDDKQLAISPPVGGEYQRYTGHPAQTRLSYLFTGTATGSIGALATPGPAEDLGSVSSIFSQINPFMQWGGSEAGAYTIYDTTPPLFPAARQTPYATLDEWMFNTQLNASNNRIPNTTGTAALVTYTQLQQLRFFLSANSEGPEVNLFGGPRISIWPINSTYNPFTQITSPCPYVTAFDQLIANAATLYPSTTEQCPYYFARTSATSPTIDFVNAASNPPGTSQRTTGGTPTNTSNGKIYQYLRVLSNKAIPGYGPSSATTFDTKYKMAEMDQILTEIFDYIRSSDPSDGLLPMVDQYSVNNRRAAGAGQSGWGYAGGGQVVPISITPSGVSTYKTKGFGRFFSISEISIDFTQSQATAPPSGAGSDTANIIVTPLIYLGLYCPSLGPPNIQPDMRVEIDGLNPAGTGTLAPVTITTTPPSVVTTAQKLYGPVTSGDAPGSSLLNPRTVYSAIPEMMGVTGSGNGSYDWHSNPPSYNFQWGGSAGPRRLLVCKNPSYQDLTNTGLPTAAIPTGTYVPNTANYMFCGIPLKIPKGSIINFSGGNLVLKFSYTNITPPVTGDPASIAPNGDGFPGAAADLVQTISVYFPPFSAPAPTDTIKTSMANRIGQSFYGPYSTEMDNTPIYTNDTIRSLIAGYNGDARLIAAQSSVSGTSTATTITGIAADTMTQPFVFFVPPTTATTTQHMQRDIFPDAVPGSSIGFGMQGFVSPGSLLQAVNYGNSPSFNGYIGDHTSTGKAATSPDANGDWDNGLGTFPDGPYINKADEGVDQYQVNGLNGYTSGPPNPGASAYYYGGSAANSSLSSPNRMSASPVTFGSLSTGVPIASIPPVPWRTLLFRPQPTHFGDATAPEDELLLDWFWMPVVDPYAISTTLATAGKVNMNYQIAPFTYITRATALMGVLGSEYVISVPIPTTTAPTTYKSQPTDPSPAYRNPVRLLAGTGSAVGTTIDYSTGTLGQFNQRFNSGAVFRSAAEICDINLVPNISPNSLTGQFDPTSASAVAAFWTANALTGDNSRERPYNGLYSRLTTKSNTYTVHVRAQSLTSPSTLPAGEWIENPQLIASEYRGSVTINRYLDPQDSNIPDFMASTGSYTSQSLDNYYKYRVLETRRFLP
jgi:uncharacterized protein (TIGR02600 family)